MYGLNGRQQTVFGSAWAIGSSLAPSDPLLAGDVQIAHEAGHLFDLGDYYWDTPKGNAPLPGFEGDIMTDTGTVSVSQWDINVIVGLKKPNFCGCKQ